MSKMTARTFIPITAMLALLSACASMSRDRPRQTTGSAAGAVEVGIIAFNDFHGALEPPSVAINATASDGQAIRVPAGGAAYLASAIQQLRARHPDSIVVSAGDLTSVSPLGNLVIPVFYGAKRELFPFQSCWTTRPSGPSKSTATVVGADQWRTKKGFASSLWMHGNPVPYWRA